MPCYQLTHWLGEHRSAAAAVAVVLTSLCPWAHAPANFAPGQEHHRYSVAKAAARQKAFAQVHYLESNAVSGQ